MVTEDITPTPAQLAVTVPLAMPVATIPVHAADDPTPQVGRRQPKSPWQTNRHRTTIAAVWLLAGGRYQDDLAAYLERFRLLVLGDVPHAVLVNEIINNLIVILNGTNPILKENLRSCHRYFSAKLAEELAIFLGGRLSVPWVYTGWREAMTGEDLILT